jgi:isoquinoline 1-oxidoreductase subunit alpha
MIRLTINGQTRESTAAPDTPLLWVLRDEFGLAGTKYGCGQALCGACTVLADGAPIRACSTAIQDIGTQKITTIEGASGAVAQAVQKAWVEREVPQCGYCQSGQIMTAIALLSENKSPTQTDIEAAMAGNICRCATYTRIKAAIQDAARTLGA